jgi:predicted DNA-binding transcriptional regulator YafY
VSEGRRFQRLLTILNEVTTRPGLHPAQLADELGVSERTLRRDLAELRGAGFDLEWEEGYQLQERLALEGAAASAAGTLPVFYEQQLQLVRGLYPQLAERIRSEVEASAPQHLALLFAQAIERATAEPGVDV